MAAAALDDKAYKKGTGMNIIIHQNSSSFLSSQFSPGTTTPPDEGDDLICKPGRAMEAEAFPIRFTKGIRSYWRRRDYQHVDGSGSGAAGRGRRRRHGLVRLGNDGSESRPRGVRVGGGKSRARRVRTPTPAPSRAATVAKAPMRVLGRIRDAYIDVMLGAARALPKALPRAPEALWQKRVPVRRSRSQARQKPDEFGQRVVLEMCKSVVASRNLSSMLHASDAR